MKKINNATKFTVIKITPKINNNNNIEKNRKIMKEEE